MNQISLWKLKFKRHCLFISVFNFYLLTFLTAVIPPRRQKSCPFICVGFTPVRLGSGSWSTYSGMLLYICIDYLMQQWCELQLVQHSGFNAQYIYERHSQSLYVLCLQAHITHIFQMLQINISHLRKESIFSNIRDILSHLDHSSLSDWKGKM